MERDELLRKITEYGFASWELHVYLDTHPCDVAATMRLKRFNEKAEELKKEYEEKYGPLTIESGNGAEWLKDPWPWEREVCK